MVGWMAYWCLPFLSCGVSGQVGIHFTETHEQGAGFFWGSLSSDCFASLCSDVELRKGADKTFPFTLPGLSFRPPARVILGRTATDSS